MTAKASLARGCGNVVSWGLKHVAHRNASTLPGRVALVVDANLIGDLSGKCHEGSIVVCGTNGKTTTNNILARAIAGAGHDVLCNWAGANMATGVATALLPGHGCDWGVFENDELSTISIVPQLKPRFFVLLNLFRDQLDRSGEIDRVQDVIARALIASPKTALLYNGDDPLCEGIAMRVRDAGGTTLAFGMGEDLGLPRDRVTGGAFCQKCGAPLKYEYRQYGQLGLYHCSACSFARPELAFTAHDVKVTRDGVSFSVEVNEAVLKKLPAAAPSPITSMPSGVINDGRANEAAPKQASRADEPAAAHAHRVHARWGGAYMAYNLLAAWSAAWLAGGTDAVFQRVLDTYDPQNGRLQHFDVRGRQVTLNLAKNPTGFNQNISMLMSDEDDKVVYVVINDDYNDGKDVSWLWDVDFERLSGDSEAGKDGRIACFVGGHRANDMQVRLKYAGIDAPIATSVGDLFDKIAGIPKDWHVYVLTNYSALWPAKAELEHMRGEER